MKKRPICAAAQDDLGGASSDEGSGVEAKRPARKSSSSTLRKSGTNDEVKDAPRKGAEEKKEKKKKEKEFAWMDSDEEDEEEAEQGKRKEEKGTDKKRGRSRDRSRSRRRGEKDKAAGDEDENQDVSAEVLDEVQSFGKMMILSPALLKKLRRMTPENVAAACRAMARTKFFDGDILRDLNDVLKRLLQREQLSAQQANDALECLFALNAYDQAVLSAVASAFRAKTATMEPPLRQVWREIFDSFKHEKDKDFRQLLETPPLTTVSPGYQRIRCFHHSKGFCAVGEKACSYSHDPRAPLSLEMHFAPLRSSPLVMTQNQYTMGRTIYGGARNGQFGN